MAGTVGGQSGTAEVMASLLPLLSLAGRSNPQTYQSLALLASLNKFREDREREDAANAATADALVRMGYSTDPRMPATNQIGLINAQIAQGNAIRAQETENRKAKEEARARDVFGKVAEVRGTVGTELPEVLSARLQTLAPEVGRSAELKTGFADTLADIRDSAKRLEMARGVARPFEETRTFDLSPRTGQVGPGPNVSLQDGEDLPLPTRGLSLDVPPIDVAPVSLTTVPDNVHALQRRIMTSGEMPKPDEASSLFNIPLTQYPGGQAFLDAQNKSPYAPFTHFAKDAQGNVTPITVQTEPRSGQPVQIRGETVKGVEAPQKPERASSHELAQSLGFVILGQPDKALPEHRGLGADQAQRLRNIIGQADQQVTPQLAASVISLQLDEMDTGLKRLDQKISGAKTDRERMMLETERTQRQLERDALSRALNRFATPGPLSATPSTPTPAGTTRVDTGRLRDAGVLKP